MGAVWLRATAQLRGRLRASLLLALLVSLSGGVVLAAVAGARRSDAALPRFLAASRTTDALVFFAGPRGGQPARTDLDAELRAMTALAQVRLAQRMTLPILSASDPDDPAGPSRQLGLVGLDRVGTDVVGRPRFVAGRPPRPDRPNEAAVDEEFVWRHGLRVGSAFRVGTYTRAQFGPAGEGVPVAPEGPAVDLRVTGIVRFPEDLLPVAEARDQVDADESSNLFLGPAFWRRYGPDLANYGMFIAVDLHRGQADVPAFTKAVERRFGRQAVVDSREFVEASTVAVGVRRAIMLETAALLAFAVLAALAAVLLLGQSLSRQVRLESTEFPTLRSLGMTRWQLVALTLVQSALVGGVGGAIAMAAAVALSPLTPLGVARRAELNPGYVTDWPVLAGGAVVIVTFVAVSMALPAWRSAHARSDSLGLLEPAGSGRPSRAVSAVAAAGAPPAAVAGARLALEPGRGRTAVPVRAALAGLAAGVCVLTAVAGFAAGMDRLAHRPAAYGVTWDLAVGGFASAAAAEPVGSRLLGNPLVVAVAASLGQVSGSIDGHYVPLTAVEERKGSLPPAVIEGREPLRPSEIALGSLTLQEVGRRVGETVTLVSDEQPPLHLRVVGRVVLHQPGFDSVITPGRGGMVHPQVMRRLAPDPLYSYPSAFLVRLDPAADREQVTAQIRRDFAGRLIIPQPHADVRNVQRVAGLPALLAALVVLLALGTVTHTLVTSVRRRRRDLAVLKALGFVRRQVSATIAWQATTFAVVALAVGVPLGLAAGRWAWELTAAALGVDSGSVVPVPAILAVAAGTVLAANLVAAVPGRAASRLRPAAALRSE
jgi:FtsX-like permease family